MLLAFVDESARDERFYFMGALIVGADEARKVQSSFDSIVEMVARQVPGFCAEAEMHAYEVFHGEKHWKQVPAALRTRVCKLASRAILDSGAKFIFRGINVPHLKARYSNPYPAHALALSHVLESIQQTLDLDYQNEAAIVHADEHHTAPDSRTRFKSMRVAAVPGYTSLPLRDLLDTIYFGPSDHSRLLQAADMATFFTNRFRTVEEKHPEAIRAMAEVENNLRAATRFSYVWP